MDDVFNHDSDVFNHDSDVFNHDGDVFSDDFDRVSQMTGISDIYGKKKSALEQHRMVYIRNREETSINEAEKLKPVDVITPIYQACEKHAKNGNTGIRVCPDTNTAKSQASTLEIIEASKIKKDPKTFQPLIYDLNHLDLPPFINKKVNADGEVEFLPDLEKFGDQSIQEVMYTKYGVWMTDFRLYPYLHTGLKCMFNGVWDPEFEPVKKWKEGLSYNDALISLMPVKRIGNIPNKKKKTDPDSKDEITNHDSDVVKDAIPVSQNSFKKHTLKDLDVLFFMRPDCSWSTKMKKVLEKEGSLNDVNMININDPENKEMVKMFGILEKGVPSFVSRKLNTGTVGYKESVQRIIDALNPKGPEDSVVVAEEIQENKKPKKFLGLF